MVCPSIRLTFCMLQPSESIKVANVDWARCGREQRTHIPYTSFKINAMR